jgi:hypothetical protein
MYLKIWPSWGQQTNLKYKKQVDTYKKKFGIYNKQDAKPRQNLEFNLGLVHKIYNKLWTKIEQVIWTQLRVPEGFNSRLDEGRWMLWKIPDFIKEATGYKQH